MGKGFENLLPIADAVATILRPHAEVVVHDLASGKVRYIANSFSKRQLGDSSLTELQGIASLDERVIGPYPKTNWDGRALKSITAVVNDASGRPIGLFCINIDVSAFETLHAIAGSFLKFPTETRPSILFENDWREEANSIVGQFLADHGLSIAALSPADRGHLVAQLDARGLFNVRNAAPYIARILNLSRATLYKTLKAARPPSPGESLRPAPLSEVAGVRAPSIAEEDR